MLLKHHVNDVSEVCGDYIGGIFRQFIADVARAREFLLFRDASSLATSVAVVGWLSGCELQ